MYNDRRRMAAQAHHFLEQYKEITANPFQLKPQPLKPGLLTTLLLLNMLGATLTEMAPLPKPPTRPRPANPQLSAIIAPRRQTTTIPPFPTMTPTTIDPFIPPTRPVPVEPSPSAPSAPSAPWVTLGSTEESLTTIDPWAQPDPKLPMPSSLLAQSPKSPSQQTEGLLQAVRVKTAHLSSSGCLGAPEKFMAIVQKVGTDDFRGQRLLNTFSNSDFQLVCLTPKMRSEPASSASLKMIIGAVQEGAILGVFTPIEGILYILPESMEEHTLSHELIHAEMRFLHSTPKCRSLIVESGLPFFCSGKQSFSEKGVAFRKAFDLGDKRLQACEVMLTKKHNGQFLNEEEKLLFSRLQKMTENCFTFKSTQFLEPQLFKMLKESGWTQSKKNFQFNITEDIAVTVVSVKDFGDNLVSWQYIFNDQVYYFRHLKDHIHSMIAEYERAVVLLFTERVAYTLDSLSEEAAHFLYPELLELLKEDYKLCI